jgi:hypothetical protein
MITEQDIKDFAKFSREQMRQRLVGIMIPTWQKEMRMRNAENAIFEILEEDADTALDIISNWLEGRDDSE